VGAAVVTTTYPIPGVWSHRSFQCAQCGESHLHRQLLADRHSPWEAGAYLVLESGDVRWTPAHPPPEPNLAVATVLELEAARAAVATSGNGHADVALADTLPPSNGHADESPEAKAKALGCAVEWHGPDVYCWSRNGVHVKGFATLELAALDALRHHEQRAQQAPALAPDGSAVEPVALTTRPERCTICALRNCDCYIAGSEPRRAELATLRKQVAGLTDDLFYAREACQELEIARQRERQAREALQAKVDALCEAVDAYASYFGGWSPGWKAIVAARTALKNGGDNA
jgi:hypothetical protein